MSLINLNLYYVDNYDNINTKMCRSRWNFIISLTQTWSSKANSRTKLDVYRVALTQERCLFFQLLLLCRQIWGN